MTLKGITQQNELAITNYLPSSILRIQKVNL